MGRFELPRVIPFRPARTPQSQSLAWIFILTWTRTRKVPNLDDTPLNGWEFLNPKVIIKVSVKVTIRTTITVTQNHLVITNIEVMVVIHRRTRSCSFLGITFDTIDVGDPEESPNNRSEYEQHEHTHTHPLP